MKELIVISGKGGTGKTSVVAAFAGLAGNAVLADCDVDAADLYLILKPEIKFQKEFISGKEANIREQDCTGCGLCYEYCRFDAIVREGNQNNYKFRIDPYSCEGCGVCHHFCPEKAIDFTDSHCGQWFISETRYGQMVHAKLGIAAENSGKLVTTVRQKAKKIAESDENEWIIVDGPPGIGCPVIASITGADAVFIVTEPTLSGKHDMERVISLTKHFKVPAMICVNKWDINPEITEEIELLAEKNNVRAVGRISYDKSVTLAQINVQTIIEYGGRAAEEVRSVWDQVSRFKE